MHILYSFRCKPSFLALNKASIAINILKTQKCFQCGEFCIDLNQICDGKIDCPDDGEDEKHCSDLANSFVTSKYLKMYMYENILA